LQATQFVRPQAGVKEQHENGLITQRPMFHHRRQERLFFGIMEVARCPFDLRNELDHPCRITVK
jgi:hypothetical protein